MFRSLPRPSILLCLGTRSIGCFTNRLFFTSSATTLTVRTRAPSGSLSSSRHAVSRGIIKVRVVTTPLSIRSMSASVRSSSPAVELVESENEVQQVTLLCATDDDHDGVIVDMKEPMDSRDFASSLRASISHWRQEEGFRYHHAEPEYLMLVYWIPESANTLPANATHRVGVGAFVMNEKREVLVVQEKNGKLRGTGVWKFPTGVVDEGEDICAAAVREVKEETGIDTEFVEALAFRQIHKSFFEKSDLFFLCMLRPLSFDIEKQELEIEAAEWMPFDKYAAQPYAKKDGLAKYIIDICLMKTDGEYSGFSPVPTTSFFSDQESYLYLNKWGLNSH